MCIIADCVGAVSQTKIASFNVGYTIDNGVTISPAQFVAYAANVESLTASNAFILPVYNPMNDYSKIVPLDLSNLSDFFAELESIYNRWFGVVTSNSLSLDTDCFNTEQGVLPVYQVGDYKFSIMPSKTDFNRIDLTQLNLDPAAKIAIDVHSADYSFIVYQFYQKGKIDITPFGYLCPLSKDQGTMIIPTIHGHPHDKTDWNSGMFGYVRNVWTSYKTHFEDQADFDHIIYTLVKSKTNPKIEHRT